MELISYKVWKNPKATIIDYIIGIFTFGRYSHSELKFSNGECFSISPRENIVRIKQIKIEPDQWDTISFKINDTKERELLKYCRELSSQHITYDYLGAVLSALQICFSNDKMFCSEVVVEVLNKFDIFNFEEGCKYTPVELHKIIKEHKI